ncbi:MAG: hypothetical protein ACK4TO_06090 [Candidatus Nitrosotenuis sp.]
MESSQIKDILYEDSNLSRVYTVRYGGKVVAFCAVSMSAIEVKNLLTVTQSKVPLQNTIPLCFSVKWA